MTFSVSGTVAHCTVKILYIFLDTYILVVNKLKYIINIDLIKDFEACRLDREAVASRHVW